MWHDLNIITNIAVDLKRTYRKARSSKWQTFYPHKEEMEGIKMREKTKCWSSDTTESC